jgi:hypothetical protein
MFNKPLDYLVAHAAQGLLDFKDEDKRINHIAWRLREGKLTKEDEKAVSSILKRVKEYKDELANKE